MAFSGHAVACVRSVGTLLAVVALVAGCRRDSSSKPAVPKAAKPVSLFTDVTDEVLPTFIHETGRQDQFFYPEIMGAGVAVLDYDNDGALDIYLIDGGFHGDDDQTENTIRNRLYRRNPSGAYDDVTDASGLGDTGYGMGCAAGDIDNDGDVDVFVTNYGPDALYRNNGDGTFTDISKSGGISDDAWGASACFADFDGDGFLDLFVTNYLAYAARDWKECQDQRGDPDYCGPSVFDGAADILYRNNADGTFADVSSPSGIAAAAARRGLGVVCRDFTGDARPDVFVANDGEVNQLWVNRRDGTFADEGFARGLAVNATGRTEAGMGVAVGDVDGDGDTDLFMTHLWKESNTLYTDLGGSVFEDTTDAAGLAPASIPLTGFGTAMIDIEHDGDLDILLVNGRVFRDEPTPGVRLEPFWSFYAERNLVFENDGRARFSDISDRAGTFASMIEVSRALVPADLDGDGDLDLVVTNCGGRARVYRNDAAKRGHWLMVRAIDPALGRDVIGAVVTVKAGGRSFTREVTRSSSYLAAGPAQVHFGLGDTSSVDSISVRWPDGTEDAMTAPPVDRKHAVLKGTGGKHE